MPQPFKFFITHSWQDIDFARRLCDDLRAHGLEGFFDAYSIQPGDDIAGRIAHGLEKCDVYVPLLSPAAVASKWCELEINTAINLSMDAGRDGRPRIIPVVIKPCKLPTLLRGKLYINFDGRYDAALNELLTKGFGVSPNLPMRPVPATQPEPQIPAPTSPTRPAIPRTWLAAGGGVIGVLVLCVLFAWIAAQPGAITASTPTKTPMPPSPTSTLGIGSTRLSADGAVMVFAPAGEFLMGSSDADTQADSNEKPQHKVYLDTFWIDKFEVTNALYKKCVDAGKCSVPNVGSSSTRSSYYGNAQYDNYPVINVSWNDAKTFCEWVGQQLPTEAQWEKAAQGTGGRIYPWGNSFDKNLLNSSEGRHSDTTAVGSYPSGASPYGAMDMAGNVWEWVADWYDGNYYKNSPARNPQGPTFGEYRVLRGGSWGVYADFVRAAVRNNYYPDFRSSYVGFRCAQ
jgi:formylglycine-generating enzyme required for sulfatase activity